MKALVYHGARRKAWEDVPLPIIREDTDAIVRVDMTTICGTDLHILKGDVPEVDPGRILGHEAVGTVESVGSAVRTLRPGDRVLAGSSGTSSTEPRPSTSGSRSPTPRPTGHPRESATRLC